MSGYLSRRSGSQFEIGVDAAAAAAAKPAVPGGGENLGPAMAYEAAHMSGHVGHLKASGVPGYDSEAEGGGGAEVGSAPLPATRSGTAEPGLFEQAAELFE